MDPTGKNRPTDKARPETQKVSDLGRRLRDLSDKVIAAGTERLSAEQIGRILSDIRTHSV